MSASTNVDARQNVVGKLIYAHRTAQKVSINKLARKAGVDPSHISRAEIGSRTFSLSLLESVADALDLNEADYLVLFAAAGYQPTRNLTSLGLLLNKVVEAMHRTDRKEALETVILTICENW